MENEMSRLQTLGRNHEHTNTVATQMARLQQLGNTMIHHGTQIGAGLIDLWAAGCNSLIVKATTETADPKNAESLIHHG
jgi:hypothetical protein